MLEQPRIGKPYQLFSANSRSPLSSLRMCLASKRYAKRILAPRRERASLHRFITPLLRSSVFRVERLLQNLHNPFRGVAVEGAWGQQSSLHSCLWWHCRGPFSSDTLELLVSQMDSFKELRAPCSGSATQRVFNQPLNRRFPMWLMLGLAGVALV